MDTYEDFQRWLQQDKKAEPTNNLEEEETPTVTATPTATETPTVTESTPVFPSPFGAKYGNSSVDLSIKENHDKMLEEYNTYWNIGVFANKEDREKRAQLKAEFDRKYYGMTSKEVSEAKGANKASIYGSNNPIEILDNSLQGMMIPGLGLIDFALDAGGTLIPGFNRIDEKWDEETKLNNPAHQFLRQVSSVVVPSMLFSGLAKGFLLAKLPQAARMSLPWWKNFATTLGVHGLGDVGITYLSDISDEETLSATLGDMFPETFGPKGRIPLPAIFKTTDSDSPGVRKVKNMLEAAPLSVFGSLLGIFLDNNTLGGAKKQLEWFQALDENAARYKQLTSEIGAEGAQLARLQEIDELIQEGGADLSKIKLDKLINEKLTIEEALGGIKSIDDLMKQADEIKKIESEAAIDRKLIDTEQLELDLGPTGLDPDINNDLLSTGATAKQTVPPGNVARNMADVAAIKSGNSAGDPAPIITDSMRRKGLLAGPTARDAVMGVAEETRDIGRFNALVDGFRYSAKEMNAAAWGIYNDIIGAETVDDLKKLFYSNRDVKNLLMGKLKVEYINEDQARAAAFAMRDLTDKFLGKSVTESSARVMDTLGREAATISQAITDMAPFIDNNRAMDLVIGKLQFLMDEYALNKYISGWSLKNKNWFDQVIPEKVDEAVQNILDEFGLAQESIHLKNKKFTQELKRLYREQPEAIKPLVNAFSHTNGDVDSLAKLFKWAEQQVTPLGLLKSPDPKNMNLFAKAAWGVRYNNMLSGISAFRAGLGNGVQLILRPMTAFLGHGVTGNLEGLKRTIYYNGAIFETNRRAIIDGFQMMKKTHLDPKAMMNTYRKDFVFKQDASWEILDGVAELWKKQNQWGKAYQYQMASRLQQFANMRWARVGMTGMVFPDVFTNTHLAHYISRLKAYDDVFSEFGFADWKKIEIAEKKHYDKFFDKDGLIKDKVVKSLAGEIQLNVDDGVSNWLTEATTAYPILKEVLTFPRTASNAMKAGASWTPVSLIPGMSKYSKTIYARSPQDIAAALAEHGINMAKTPNAQVIFEQLKAEYIGRLAFSSLLVSTLWQYAIAGNIRGNGHYNASERNRQRDELNYEPKTIKIGDKWYSFKGIIGLEHMLTLIGDLAMYGTDSDEHILENFGAKLTWTVGATFLNESPLAGVEPLFDALNGNQRAWRRLVGQSASSWVPMSSGLGVVNNAIDDAQRILSDDWVDYVKNKFPVTRGPLAKRINFWDGKEVRDTDNWFLRKLNAISPIQVSDGQEPWQIWLQDIGYKGQALIKMDSTGSYEWSPHEAEEIYRIMGNMGLVKEVKRLMKNKRYNDEIAALSNHRKNSIEYNKARIQLKTNLLPVHQELNTIIRNALKKAEAIYLKDHPNVKQAIINAIEAKARLKTGDVQGAAKIQKRDLETKQLINYGN